MLTVLGDTHRREGHGLAARTLEAVRTADVVAHAGDFTTAAVHAALADECARLCAVAGNNDDPELRERLPARATFEAEGLAVVLVHGHEHSAEALSLLGREAGADLVVSGHSHRPGVERAAGRTLLSPGSHADPRWYRPAHAELERAGDVVRGRLVEPEGTVFERFEVVPSE